MCAMSEEDDPSTVGGGRSYCRKMGWKTQNSVESLLLSHAVKEKGKKRAAGNAGEATEKDCAALMLGRRARALRGFYSARDSAGFHH